ARDRVMVLLRSSADIDYGDIGIVHDLAVIERGRCRLGQRLDLGQTVGADFADVQFVDQRGARKRLGANAAAPAGADHCDFDTLHLQSPSSYRPTMSWPREQASSRDTLTNRCGTTLPPRPRLDLQGMRTLSDLSNAEHLRCEPRIDLDELRGDDAAQGAQRLSRGRTRHRYLRGMVEIETCGLDDFGDRVPRMHAREFEAPTRSIEGEQAATGDERDGSARTINVACARPRRAYEIDLFDQRARAVLEAEQDHLGHDVVEIGRAEGAGKTYHRARVVADADEIDVALAVDLSAREKKHVDTALAGAVEEFASAIGEEVLLPAA